MIETVVVARDGADLTDCLDALAAAGVQQPRVERLPAPGGWAAARIAALNGCTSEVLALVEDDVLVSHTWLRALRDAWEDETVAVVSGPLRSTAPGWAGAALHDEASATFHGGNVAFRAAALRGAGGFANLHGDPHARDWFGDEHEAQRELERGGWTRAFAPEMAATRIAVPTGARDVARARLRFGGRQALVGEPPAKGAAARTLVTSAAGALAGRRAERAGRAAQALGVLLGPRAAAGSLERNDQQPPPATTKTQERVLLFHRVVELDEDPAGLAVSPATFEATIARIAPRAVALHELATAPPDAVAITFDDGYADNLRRALPILERHDVPATIFVSTGHVAFGIAYWWDAVVAATAAPGPRTATIADHAHAWRDASAARRALLTELQAHPAEAIAAVLTELGAPQAPPPDRDRPCTPAEIRTLAEHPLITIGAHSRSHPSLARTDPARRADELRGSADDLESWTGTRPTAVAYPYGVPGVDVDDATAQAARDAGYTLGVVNGPGTPGDPLRIGRSAVVGP